MEGWFFNFSKGIITELTGNGRISDLVGVISKAIKQSILNASKEDLHPTSVQVLQAQLENKSLELKTIISEILSAKDNPITSFGDEGFQKSIHDRVLQVCDYSELEISEEQFIRIIKQGLNTIEYRIIDNLSSQQWAYFISNKLIKLDEIDGKQGQVLAYARQSYSRLDKIVKKVDILLESSSSNIDSKSIFAAHRKICLEPLEKEFGGIKLRELYVDPYIGLKKATPIGDEIAFLRFSDIFNKAKSSSQIDFSNRSLYLFKGLPGVGKSTCISHFVSELKDEQFCLIKLNEVDKSLKTKKLITQQIKETLEIEDYKLEDVLNKSIPFYLVLDGLDEYNVTEDAHNSILDDLANGLTQFIKRFGGTLKVLVFGRPSVMDKLDFEEISNVKIDIYPLVLDEISSFDNRLELLNKITSQYDDSLQDFVLCNNDKSQFPLTQYPLFLIQLVTFYLENNELRQSLLNSSGKYELYEIINNEYFKRESKKATTSVKKSDDFFYLFEEISYEAWRNGEVKQLVTQLPVTISGRKEFQNISVDGVALSNLYRLQASSKWYEFVHKSFGEFFAARYFIRRLQEIISEGYNFDSYLVSFYALFESQQISRDQYQWIKSGLVSNQIILKIDKNILVNFNTFIQELTSKVFSKNTEDVYKPLIEERFMEIGLRINHLVEGIFSILLCFSEYNKSVGVLTIRPEYAWYKKSFYRIWHKYSSVYKYHIYSIIKDDLDAVNLSETNLRDADLRDADLRDADLSRTNLSLAKLRGADLSEADLSGADLCRTFLREAKLSGANLREAKLSGANLREAKLSGANLRDANLSGANLSGADLRETKLRDADLSLANLRDVNLSFVDLREADLSEVDLSLADLIGADLRDADLSGANLRGANLRDADLRDAKLRDADLRRAKLSGADLSGANLSFVDLSGAKLRDAKLRDADFKNVILNSIQLNDIETLKQAKNLSQNLIKETLKHDLSGSLRRELEELLKK